MNFPYGYAYTVIAVTRLQLLHARLEHCVTDIGHWMSANRLKLNAEKTELLWTGTKHSLSLLGGCGPCLRLEFDLMHTELHWLYVPDRVKYKLGVLIFMYRSQHNPTGHCSPVSDVVFRQCLRSASSHQLSVPRYQLSTYGRRAFSVAGPTVWNSLPEDCADSYSLSLLGG